MSDYRCYCMKLTQIKHVINKNYLSLNFSERKELSKLLSEFKVRVKECVENG